MKNKRPRYARTARLAAITFKKYGIKRLPVNPDTIIQQHKNWAKMSYDEFGSIKGWDTEEVIVKIGSNDGCAIYDSDKDLYLILYNDHPLWVASPRRIVWTIVHEIGHIILGHLKETGESKVTRANLSKSQYKLLEAEAEYFAASLLAPAPVLFRLNANTYEKIMDICNISKQAAQNRLKHLTLRKRQKRSFSDDLLVDTLFHDYCFQKKCLTCSYGFVSKKAKYCPICGDNLKWGEGFMIYDGYELDENSKAVECPKCGNGEPEKGEYCSICGVYLVNKCTDVICTTGIGQEYIEEEGCGALLSGNARFCTYCGNPTTFFEAGLLCAWEETKEKPGKEEANDRDKIATIPF